MIGTIQPQSPHSTAIPLSRPDITEDDIAAVVNVLRTPTLSLGPQLQLFEERIAAFVGARHAVAVNSGTSALHLCMRALGIGEGDEVITTPFSFIASANCILFEKAVPRFVDIEPQTLCLDPALVEAAITPRTKAILAVDVFGYLCDWDALRAIADRHDLALIEDSCEALGSSRDGRHAGTFGDCGTFAFYPNKQMTTGEGGVIVTDRPEIASLARSMRNQGRGEGNAWLQHERLGFNYRMSDINCALGTSQLQRLPTFLSMRAQVAAWYTEELQALADLVHAPVMQPGVDISWFVYVVRLADRFTRADRDRALAALRERGIGCNNYFPPIHLQPFYRELLGTKEGDFPVTEGVSDHTMALPFHNHLSKQEIQRVCATLREILHA